MSIFRVSALVSLLVLTSLRAGPAAALEAAGSGIPDGSGGIIAVCAVPRGEYEDLNVQRLNAAGAPLWTTAGVLLCTTAVGYSTPALVSDGAGGAIVAWRDARGGNSLYVQRVNAAGATQWTPGGVVLCSSIDWSEIPSIVSDGASGAIIAWRDRRSGVDDIYAQRVNALGATQWAVGGVPVCTASGTQYRQTIVPDGSGGAILAWQDHRGSDPDIYAQRLSASGVAQWTPDGVAVCAASSNQENPRADSCSAGRIVIAGEDSRGGSPCIYAQRMNSNGSASWVANGVALCTAAGGQSQPAVASDGTGGAIVSWIDYRGGTSGIYVRRVDASGAPQWTADGVALRSVGYCGQQLIAPDRTGGAIVAWGESDNGPNRVRAQRVSAAGIPQWNAGGVPLCSTSPYDQESPTVSPDGSGGAIVAWNLNVIDVEMYAQRVSAAGSLAWSAPAALHVDPGADHRIAVIADGAGGTIATWMEKRNGQYDIVARRMDAGGVTLWPRAEVCTVPGDQLFPALTTDGSGGAIVTWIDARDGSNVHLYAQRISASGAALWTADGVEVCPVPGWQIGAGIVQDGGGGAIIAWQDVRNPTGDWNIYAQRLNASGVAQWTATGVPLTTTPGYQALPEDSRADFLAPDGTGGAIVAWTDESGSSRDIYAQRVDGSGATRWATNGLAVCTATGDQTNAIAVPDGANGILIVWRDQRAGGNSNALYA